MALAYDYSYQEWLKSHPKPIPPPTPVVKKLQKAVMQTQTPKKVEKPKPYVWQSTDSRGFKTRADWRRWRSGHDRAGGGGSGGMHGTGGSPGRTGGAY